jgi:hypothetical protein
VGETALSSQAAAESELVCGRGNANGRSCDQREVRDVGQRRAQRDDLLDVFRAALRENLRKQSAAAMTDQRDGGVVLLVDLCHSVT